MAINKIFFAIVLLTVCCSCSDIKEEQQDKPNDTQQIQIKVSIKDDIASKTVASDEGTGYSVTWTGDEVVSVNGIESLEMSVNEDNSRSATFTFENLECPYSCVYPASACKQVLGTVGLVELPSEQKYVSGSFDPDAALMVGYSTNENRIEFHHAVAYLNVSVITPEATPISSIAVSGNKSERMSGEFAVDFTSLKVSSDECDGTRTTLVADASAVPSGEGVLIAIPVRTYEKGISLHLTFADGQTKTVTSSVVFPAVVGSVYSTVVSIEDKEFTIEGLNSMPKVPMEFEEGELSDYFEMSCSEERFCVAGDKLELSAKFSLDLPCTFDVAQDASQYVNLYNEEYYSNSILLPTEMYSCSCSKSDNDGLTLVLNIDQDKVFNSSSDKSYVLPLQVKYGSEPISDVFYAFVPSYTVAADDGMVTVHLSDYATMDIYYADSSNDKAVIYCPGGGYSNTSLPDMDTKPVFKNSGVTAGVLWYRKPTAQWQGLKELPLTDVTDALAVLKAHSSEWGGYTKYGIAGRSAGGHLSAVSAAYHKDEFDFQILLYPVITMEPGKTHNGSLKNFLGSESPSRDLIDAWSAEKLVTKDTPRAYVAYSTDDATVPQEYNGKAMCAALQEAGVSHLAKEYTYGGHSINWDDFPTCLHDWLKTF